MAKQNNKKGGSAHLSYFLLFGIMYDPTFIVFFDFYMRNRLSLV